MTKKLFEIIDELKEKYIGVWQDVCNIESPTKDKTGVDKVGEYFCRIAKEQGWQVEIFPQPIAGNVVCITMNPEATLPPVSLSGHIDTVHPHGRFGYPPVKCDNEKIYGPGVYDCKGGVVSGLFAMGESCYCSGEYIVEYNEIKEVKEVLSRMTSKGEIVLVELYNELGKIGYDKLFLDEYHKIRLKIYQNNEETLIKEEN